MTVGLVTTVLGEIEPSELGRTMMHEHLLITFDRWARDAGIEQPPEGPAITLANRGEIAVRVARACRLLRGQGWVVSSGDSLR